MKCNNQSCSWYHAPIDTLNQHPQASGAVDESGAAPIFGMQPYDKTGVAYMTPGDSYTTTPQHGYSAQTYDPNMLLLGNSAPPFPMNAAEPSYALQQQPSAGIGQGLLAEPQSLGHQLTLGTRSYPQYRGADGKIYGDNGDPERHAHKMFCSEMTNALTEERMVRKDAEARRRIERKPRKKEDERKRIEREAREKEKERQ